VQLPGIIAEQVSRIFNQNAASKPHIEETPDGRRHVDGQKIGCGSDHVYSFTYELSNGTSDAVNASFVRQLLTGYSVGAGQDAAGKN